MSVQPVTATIVDFDARGSGWDSHIVFIVSVSTAGGSCWTVERRYSEFKTLYDAAARTDFAGQAVAFPRKVLGGLNEKQLNDRRAGLSSFLSILLSLPAISGGAQLALKHFFTRASTEAKAEELNWPTPIAAGVRDAVVGREVVVVFEETALGVRLEDTLTLTQGSVMQVSDPVGEVAFAKGIRVGLVVSKIGTQACIGPGSANTVAAAVPIVQSSARPLNISFVEGFMQPAQPAPVAQPAAAAVAVQQPVAQVQQPQVQAAAVAAIPPVAPVAAATAALPPGWEAHTDPNTNTTYYYHPVSGKSQWTVPEA